MTSISLYHTHSLSLFLSSGRLQHNVKDERRWSSFSYDLDGGGDDDGDGRGDYDDDGEHDLHDRGDMLPALGLGFNVSGV